MIWIHRAEQYMWEKWLCMKQRGKPSVCDGAVNQSVFNLNRQWSRLPEVSWNFSRQKESLLLYLVNKTLQKNDLKCFLSYSDNQKFLVLISNNNNNNIYSQI